MPFGRDIPHKHGPLSCDVIHVQMSANLIGRWSRRSKAATKIVVKLFSRLRTDFGNQEVIRTGTGSVPGSPSPVRGSYSLPWIVVECELCDLGPLFKMNRPRSEGFLPFLLPLCRQSEHEPLVQAKTRCSKCCLRSRLAVDVFPLRTES